MSQKLDKRFFIVGCILLAVGLVFAAWAFSLKCLSNDQSKIIQIVLSLASGFAAWTFTGSLNVKAKGVLPGVLITATGGFGVWLITIYMLIPAINADPRCQDNSLSFEERKINEYMGYLIATSGDYERIDKYPNYLETVRKNGEKYADSILVIDEKKLHIQFQLIQTSYASLGYILSALAEDRANKPNSKRINSLIDTALGAANKFDRQYSSLIEKSSEQWAIETREWLNDQSLVPLVRYNKATAKALASKYDESPTSEAFRFLRLVDPLYLEQHDIKAELIFQWLCNNDINKIGEDLC